MFTARYVLCYCDGECSLRGTDCVTVMESVHCAVRTVTVTECSLRGTDCVTVMECSLRGAHCYCDGECSLRGTDCVNVMESVHCAVRTVLL